MENFDRIDTCFKEELAMAATINSTSINLNARNELLADLRNMDPIVRRNFLLDYKSQYRELIPSSANLFSLDLDIFVDILENSTLISQNKTAKKYDYYLNNFMPLLYKLELLSMLELVDLKNDLIKYYRSDENAAEAFDIAVGEFKIAYPGVLNHRDPLFGTKSIHSQGKRTTKWSNVAKILDHRIEDEIAKRDFSKTFDDIVDAYIFRLQELKDAGFAISQERIDAYKELLHGIEIVVDTQTVHNVNAAARFNGSHFEIYLNRNPYRLSPEDLQYLLFHEFTHFLSSTNIVSNRLSGSSGFSHSKNSNHTNGHKIRYKAQVAFNEAVTDTIACWLMSKITPDFSKMCAADFFNPMYQNKNFGYPVARNFFSEILNIMPIRNMIKAYLDDYNPKNQPGVRTNHKQALANDIAFYVKGGYNSIARRWSTFSKLSKETDFIISISNVAKFIKDIRPITYEWSLKLKPTKDDHVLINGNTRRPKLVPANETPAFVKYGQNPGEPLRINGEGIAAAHGYLTITQR